MDMPVSSGSIAKIKIIAELKAYYFDLIDMINANVTGNGILPLHAHTFLDVWPVWVVANYRTRRFGQHHCWKRSSC